MGKQIVEDCEALSNVINGLPVFEDCIHTANHVIGFVHVYKSSIFIEDVREIHPQLVDIYKHCHGGLSAKYCDHQCDEEENDEEIVEENEKYEYDDSGYWMQQKSKTPTTKRRKIKKKRLRHFWFVDRVFEIKPYEVCGTLGGISKFYNLSKRNYADSVYLARKLTNYLMMESKQQSNNEFAIETNQKYQ